MSPRMRLLAPALMLALAACSAPAPSSGDERPIARVVTGRDTSTELAQKFKEKNVAATDGEVTKAPGSATPEIDTTRRFEYADVTVDLGDPNGMRALVQYLMKPEVWTLVKCEMTSTTSKHYRFQKVTSNDGRSLPDVDIFKTRR